MRLTTDDIIIMVAALNRAISRHEGEARYAKAGKGANNVASTLAKVKKLRDLRDRMLEASGIIIVEN